MNRIFKALVIFYVLVLLLTPISRVGAQGGGCGQNVVSPEGVLSYTVIKSVELSKTIPENLGSNPKAQGVFHEYTVTVDYQPGWIVLLASTPDGIGWTCADDRVRLVSSAGWVYEHSYVSPDKRQILSQEPVNVTGLFSNPGTTQVIVTIYLYDDAPDRLSSSPYWLVVIEPPSVSLPPPAEIFPLATPTVAAPPTVEPSPTSRPTATYAPSPSLTPPSPRVTPTTVGMFFQVLPPAAVAEVTPGPVMPMGELLGRLGLGLALMVLAGWSGRTILTRPRLRGLLKIKKNGEPYDEVDLNRFWRSRVPVGTQGKIKIEDDTEAQDLPDIGAWLLARRDEQGANRVYWVEVNGVQSHVGHDLGHLYPLKTGDQESFGPYIFEYVDYDQLEVEEDILSGGEWHEWE